MYSRSRFLHVPTSTCKFRVSYFYCSNRTAYRYLYVLEYRYFCTALFRKSVTDRTEIFLRFLEILLFLTTSFCNFLQLFSLCRTSCVPGRDLRAAVAGRVAPAECNARIAHEDPARPVHWRQPDEGARQVCTFVAKRKREGTIIHSNVDLNLQDCWAQTENFPIAVLRMW